MVTKAIRATFDGHSFHVIDPVVDLAPDSECLIYVKEVKPKQTEDAVNYLFSIAGTAHGPRDLSKEHDHYLYGTPKPVNLE
jgi:hypothetical protein